MSTYAIAEIPSVHYARLLDITRQLAASRELDALLRGIIDAACEVMECERATLFLYDRRTNELFSHVGTGDAEIRIRADAGLAGAAATTREPVNVVDAYNDPRFYREVDRKTGFVTRSVLSLALENLEGELVGVLQAINKHGRPFDRGDIELAKVLAAQAGVAVHRWKLLEEYAEKKRMARDLEIARQIQRQQLPGQSPATPGFELAGWNRSADETGGDCYDFVTLPDGRVALFLADASGHGLGAALVVCQCRAMLRATLATTTDLSDVCSLLNRLLGHDLPEGKFITAFVGILDPANSKLEYVSAGQGPMLTLRNGNVQSLVPQSIPLGILDDAEFVAESVTFSQGEMFAILTDGFFETTDTSGELFGETRVARLLSEHGQAPLTTIIEEVRREVDHFRSDGVQLDDLTALLIRRAPS